MVTVIDDKLMFGRDQVVTSTQASKNFGAVRRRARKQPVFISDRNDGIDTVIVGFDEFEDMARELVRLREERFYTTAANRVAAADADPDHTPLMLEDMIGSEAYEELINQDAETVSDEELFA